MSEERNVLTGDVPQVAPRDEPVRGETLREVMELFVMSAGLVPCTSDDLRWWVSWMREAMERDDKEGSR